MEVLVKKSLDLLLVNPSTNAAVYGPLYGESALEMPFIAGVAAAHVQDAGFSVQLLDANVARLNAQETAEAIKSYNPRLVTMIVHGPQPSASSQLMAAVGETCRAIKGVSDVPILLTGLHPSSLPERTLREEQCDYVARGEEFPTILGLTAALANNGDVSKVPGLAYLTEGKYRQIAPAPLPKKLDEAYPRVAWDLFPPLSQYRAHNWHAFTDFSSRSPFAALYTSLGCPFACDFCVINAAIKASRAALGSNDDSAHSDLDDLSKLNIEKGFIRSWSPEKIGRDIEYLVEKQDVKHLKFIDEMYVLRDEHNLGIAQQIEKRGYGKHLNIWAYARVDTVEKPVVLETMRRGGVRWLVLGIESMSEHVRDGANKVYTNEDIVHSLENVRKAGIHILGNYIVGLEGDTSESMQQTLDFALQYPTEWFNLYACMAYPGAPNYLRNKARGIALPGDVGIPGGWGAYSHHNYNTFPLPTSTLTNADVLAFRDKAWNAYMTNPAYHALLSRKFGDNVVAHVKQLAQTRLPRRILGDPVPAVA
jgi:hypothetical protein